MDYGGRRGIRGADLETNDYGGRHDIHHTYHETRSKLSILCSIQRRIIISISSPNRPLFSFSIFLKDFCAAFSQNFKEYFLQVFFALNHGAQGIQLEVQVVFLGRTGH
jgi:hypothetical protein